MSKIIMLKLVIRDSHNPDERVYEETSRFDNLNLNDELQLVYQATRLLEGGVSLKPPPPMPKPPRNRHGDPHTWESRDGRRTAVSALAKPHAKNILQFIHQCAVEEHAIDVEQWCLENYPQYPEVRRRAGVPMNQQRSLFTVGL